MRKLYVYFEEMFIYKYRQELQEIFMDFFIVVWTIHEHNTRQNNHYRAPLAAWFHLIVSIKVLWGENQ